MEIDEIQQPPASATHYSASTIEINGTQQPPTHSTLNSGQNVTSAFSMDITRMQQPPTSTTVNSAIHCNAINSTPTCVASSSTTHNRHPLMLSYTPGGSEQWMRRVEMEFTPKLGMFFSTLAEGLLFYKVYALSCGFEPRLYTTKKQRDGEIYKKSVVCNRQGYRENRTVEENKINTRSVKITRIGCLAMIRFRYTGKGYVVDMFHNFHNHILCSVKDAHLQKLTRKLNAFHKQTIINNSKVNIGASMSFRLCKEYADGYENVGASLTDFKNFNRDVKCFIGSKDAQMIIDRFKEIAETNKGFYYAYYTDEEQVLSRLFWCDSECRQNYSLFGDSFSFDATYGTNKYNMVFAPFTGVDHHKRSVTFAATLLEHEDEESFKWCFEKFLDAMNQKEPQCVITDQAPGVILAVPAVFKKARHRFCMWHIMQKLSMKVGTALCKDTVFLSRFNSIVWDSTLDVTEFESKWADVITEYKLEDNDWLKDIYAVRAQWIPAYFTDLPMGSILRTTQRSESENSFFKRFENKFGTLVEFWMRFESAIDQQRHAQQCLDKESDHSLPKIISPLPIEKHASTVYTHAVFKEFREEVEAAICSCGVVDKTHDIDHEYSDVGDGIIGKMFKVVYTISTKEASCSCKLFERKGLLCSHIICVWQGKQISLIHEKYILKRWTKNSYRSTFDVNGIVDENVGATHYHNLAVSGVWTEFYSIIPVLKSLPEGQVKELSDLLKSYREKFCSQNLPLTKEQEMEQLLGCSSSSTVTILPPRRKKNKGRGKRLLSVKQQAIKKAKKPKRLCNNCKRMSYHDKRNCPNPFVKKAPVKTNDDSSSEEEDAEEDDEEDEEEDVSE